METSFFFHVELNCKSTSPPPSDPDQDGIYTGSVVLDTPYLGVEFKCVLNGFVFELEKQPIREVAFDQGCETTTDVVFDQR